MTLTSDVTTAISNIFATRDQIAADGDLLHDIVHGPASGAASLVTTDAGAVKTIARRIQEVGAGAKVTFATLSQASGATIDAGVTTVMIGSVPYLARSSNPVHALKFQAADARWFAPEWLVLAGLGDSNNLGNPTATTGDKTQDPNVFAYKPTTNTIVQAALGAEPFRVAAGDPNNVNFHAAKTLVTLTGRPVLIICASVAGANISQWTTTTYYTGGSGVHWNSFVGYATACLAKAELLGHSTVDAVIWSMGVNNNGLETASFLAWATGFRNQLRASTLIAANAPWVTQECCRPEMGGVSYNHNATWQDFFGTGVDLFAGPVSSRGLDDVGDGVHFTGAALEEMGERAARQIVDLAAGRNDTWLYDVADRDSLVSVRTDVTSGTSGSPLVINHGQSRFLVELTTSQTVDRYVQIDPANWSDGEWGCIQNNSRYYKLIVSAGAGTIADSTEGGAFLSSITLTQGQGMRIRRDGTVWRQIDGNRLPAPIPISTVPLGTSSGAPLVIADKQPNQILRMSLGSETGHVQIDPGDQQLNALLWVFNDSGTQKLILYGGSGFFLDPVTGSNAATLTLPPLTSEIFIRSSSGGARWRPLIGPQIINAALPRVQVDTFTASGTWTKPAWAREVTLIGVSAGGGGGGGRRGAAGSNRYGGGGGAGGQYNEIRLDAEDLPSSLTVTIGSGGTAGAAATADDTNGGNGGAGGATLIESVATVYLTVYGGPGGSGGSGSAGAGGTAATGYYPAPAMSGGSGSNSTGAAPTVVSGAVPGAGGGGGGLSTGDAASGGGSGGRGYRLGGGSARTGAQGSSGSAGASGGTGGAKGWSRGTGGGGGGGGGHATTPGSGGAGGAPGGAGGGGGASTNGAASGAGGDGARGEAWIISIG